MCVNSNSKFGDGNLHDLQLLIVWETVSQSDSNQRPKLYVEWKCPRMGHIPSALMWRHCCLCFLCLQNLQNAISNYRQINGPTDLCYDVTGVDNPTFPTVAFQFTGTDSSTTEKFQISDSSLFFPVDTNTCCLAMASSSKGPAIIGYIHQADHLFIFDNVNKQIGWAQTTCWDHIRNFAGNKGI